MRRCVPDGGRLRCEAELACATAIVDDHDLRWKCTGVLPSPDGTQRG